MRIDHYAFQRGTRVAGFGLMVQLMVGLTLLLFGLISRDTVFTFASIYVLAGLLVWVSLIIIFHQHKLERLEALEDDELSAARPGSTSIFEARPDEQRVAARRLALMHRWLMPSVSLALAIFLGLMAWWQFGYLGRVGDAADARGTEFVLTPYVGWGLAICLAFALVSFIISRFVAGMAKLDAWQNLRGGAGYMVGNALIMLAVAVGMVFRVFNNEDVIRAIAYAIPIYMIAVAVEIVLNFVLNLYRPRIPGEVPRPAFDSRILSLLAAPDSLVKSLNEAVNYQFGFDITSSWGYQLLLRSFVWLLGIGAAALVLLNMMVVVEPHQQAVKLSFGKVVGEVHDSGIMWKWPWPFQTAQIVDVDKVRTVNLTARRHPDPRPVPVNLWTEELRTDAELEPFIVGSTVIADDRLPDFDFDFHFDVEGDEPVDADDQETPAPGAEPVAAPPLEAESDAPGFEPSPVTSEPMDEVTAAVSRAFALVDAEMSLHYRIRRGASDAGVRSGLLDYLRFVPDVPTRHLGQTQRDRAFRAIALREVTQYLSTLPIDDVLSQSRGSIGAELHRRVQRAMDDERAGIEVVAVNVPLVRPRGHDLAGHFEEVGGSMHARRELIAKKQGEVTESLANLVGDPATATRVLSELDELDRLEREHGPQSPEAINQRVQVERLLRRSGGLTARVIADAETERWVDLMNKRAQATRTQSQALAYQASPELYRQRELMRVLGMHLSRMRKYVIGIDPSRINIDADLRELSPLVDFSSAMPSGEGGSNQ